MVAGCTCSSWVAWHDRNGEHLIIFPFCSCCVYIQADRPDVHLVVPVFIYHVWETLSECMMYSDTLAVQACNCLSSFLLYTCCADMFTSHILADGSHLNVALPLLNKVGK